MNETERAMTETKAMMAGWQAAAIHQILGMNQTLEETFDEEELRTDVIEIRMPKMAGGFTPFPS
jgi:hypothetical protein